MINILAFWPFASGWMLLWSLAAVLPILIHLWSRRRYTQVPWAAMEYLLAAIRRNARRLRIEQLILLAVRTSILLLLGIALARPVLSWIPNLHGPSHVTGDTLLVLVIDGSYSMDYRPENVTRFDLAKGIAQQLVRQTRQGDGVVLINMADPPRIVIGQPAFEPEDVIHEVSELRRTDGGADLLATLAEIEQIFDATEQRVARLQRRRVCFLTDLDRVTWSVLGTDAGRAALAKLSDRAELRLFDVGQSGAQNTAIIRLAAANDVATITRPIRLNAEIENFGSQDRSDVAVTLLVDGRQILQQHVAIGAGDRTIVSTHHRFVAPGQHTVEARLGEDHLAVDNVRWLSLPVRSTIRVLCVEGKVGSAQNVAIALQPQQSRHAEVQPVIRSENALLEEDLSKYDVIFICNVGRFDRDEARSLASFVQRGGGIVFWLGDQTDSGNYNAMLGTGAGKYRLLPVQVGQAVPTGGYALDPLGYHHAIVEPFRGNEQAGLLTTPIWKYVKLEPHSDPSVRTALAFQNGDPAIVEQAVERGRVIVVATAASSASVDRTTNGTVPWSAWSAWPSFLPLVQQMLKTAASDHNRGYNVLVGQPIDATLPSDVVVPWVTVSIPGQGHERVPVETHDDVAGWSFSGTRRSGIYTVELDSAGRREERYAVNLDTRESRVDRLDTALLPAELRRQASAAPVNSANKPSVPETRHFKYVLGLILALLFAETFLAWYFGRDAA